jgi:hypothetical protein
MKYILFYSIYRGFTVIARFHTKIHLILFQYIAEQHSKQCFNNLMYDISFQVRATSFVKIIATFQSTLQLLNCSPTMWLKLKS